MKATGIVRRIDGLGRIVIPMEIRKTFGIKDTDPMEIFTTKEGIVIRPYRVGCECCGSEEKLVSINGITLCQNCVKKFQAEASPEED